MKKIKFLVLYILFSILGLFIASCSNDNPLNPDGPYQFESARYNWTTDTILYQYTGIIFGLDTSHVYIIGTHSVTFFDGKSYTRHSYGDLYFNAIDGVDPNHIYIAGAFSNGDNRLMKWDGSVFHDISVPGDTNLRGGLTAVYAKSINDIWLGSIGKIFFSNGSSCIEYEIDSAYGISSFAELNGNLIAYGRRPLGILNSDTELYVYKFEGNSWTRIYFRRFSYTGNGIVPVKLGNELYGCMNGLLKFNGSDFYKILEPPTGFDLAVIVGGNTDNEFLTFAFSEHEAFYANWNGNKWSKEFSVISAENMKKVGRNYYLVESPCSSCNFILLHIGRPNF